MSSLSRRQEDRGAKAHGGRRISGSGNGWAVKNDVRNDLVSYEMKTTKHRSFSLKLDELKKAENNSLLDGRESTFEIEFANETEKRTFMTVPAAFYYQMYAAWEREQRGNSG